MHAWLDNLEIEHSELENHVRWAHFPMHFSEIEKKIILIKI